MIWYLSLVFFNPKNLVYIKINSINKLKQIVNADIDWINLPENN